MKSIQFPVFKTKKEDLARIFDLSDPAQRQEYFQAKAGEEIKKIRAYLKENTFIAYLLGKKGAGKGTYAKLFEEAVGPMIEHFSAGDMIRKVDLELQDEIKKKELIAFLENNYRGFTPLAEIIEALESRSTTKLLPTELILALTKREISQRGRKALFIDGFPRNLDQISYSLFFRDLVGYRDDPDVFILIDVPESVIEARIKSRVVCPQCQTSRNINLLITKKIGYDQKKNEFCLICDNPQCGGAVMVKKEGDDLGLAPIRERLELDGQLIGQALSLYGIPKILLRNSVPVETAKEYVDDYEITPEYSFEWDEENKKVKVVEKPFIVLDDNGVQSYSLLAPPVVISLIKQLVEALGL